MCIIFITKRLDAGSHGKNEEGNSFFTHLPLRNFLSSLAVPPAHSLLFSLGLLLQEILSAYLPGLYLYCQLFQAPQPAFLIYPLFISSYLNLKKF